MSARGRPCVFNKVVPHIKLSRVEEEKRGNLCFLAMRLLSNICAGGASPWTSTGLPIFFLSTL